MELKNFKLDLDGDGLLLASWDMPDRSMNVWNEDSLHDFEQIIASFASDAHIKGLILASNKPSFCAGADLTMLASMKAHIEQIALNEGEIAAKKALLEQSARLSKVLRQMELVTKPVVAAINGTALGGGFELCLAANARFAAQNTSTKLGLPEVKIGLLPGAGGTQRLPRMIGAQEALQIILQGQELKLERALALKLVDAVVPPKKLIGEAKAWAKAHMSVQQAWDQDKFKLPGGVVYSPTGMQLWSAANAIYRRETYDLYPAGKAIMRAMYEGLLVSFDAALRIESRYFAFLLTTKEAQAMIRTLFVSMGELNKGARRPSDVKPSKFKAVGVLGAGFMGAGIAGLSARAGIDVVLLDQSEEAAQKGKDMIAKKLGEQVMKGHMSGAERDAQLARITPTAEYAALKDVDFVIEAVFESREVKQQVITQAAAHVKSTVVFGSNTSTLPISSLQGYYSRPKDFIGVHFFSPVEKMMLVEVIIGKKTGKKALAQALDFVKAIKKTPIVVNDSRGFFANRCVISYLREGHLMLKEGVPPAMIENLARMAGMPVGPLALNDEVALDLGWKILQATKADLGVKAVDPVQEALLHEMVVVQGRFGRKNAMGFYDYPLHQPKTLWAGLAQICPPKAPELFDRQELMQRFLVVQALEAARCVEEKVVVDMREADVGSILGFGFAPFSGGAISYIDAMGVEEFTALCDYFAKKYGKRFAPCRLLRDMAEAEESFYARFQPSKS